MGSKKTIPAAKKLPAGWLKENKGFVDLCCKAPYIIKSPQQLI